jgi:hypothetical protein
MRLSARAVGLERERERERERETLSGHALTGLPLFKPFSSPPN